MKGDHPDILIRVHWVDADRTFIVDGTKAPVTGRGRNVPDALDDFVHELRAWIAAPTLSGGDYVPC